MDFRYKIYLKPAPKIAAINKPDIPGMCPRKCITNAGNIWSSVLHNPEVMGSHFQ